MKRNKECIDHQLIIGKILVTRSPCVHPGDIRLLYAVDEPLLYDYVNVIVFSGRGERPDFNKMGSGDLDGDLYWINWNHHFVNFYKEAEPDRSEIKNKIDRSFTLSSLFSKLSINESVSMDESENREKGIDNFIRYIKNDILGQIANLHIKIADNDIDGVYTDEGLSLSKMHCQAVDAQKHDTELDTVKFYEIK